MGKNRPVHFIMRFKEEIMIILQNVSYNTSQQRTSCLTVLNLTVNRQDKTALIGNNNGAGKIDIAEKYCRRN
jgi:ABC-type transport system involved in cytochrome bd biosynthesis fused ATPase/permease subunit